MKIPQDELIYNMSDEQYHAQSDNLEKHNFSSSQLKTMNKDPYLFFAEYCLGEKKATSRQTQDNFDTGTYFHTHFLEPEKLMDQFAVFEGAKRVGKDWKEFEKANEGKIIMNQTMVSNAQTLIEGVERNQDCLDQLKDIQSEVSIFTSLNGVKVKCRFDILNGMIGGDLKSTSIQALGNELELQKAISTYGYDMSYALYRDIYEKVTGNTMEGFFWIFASKAIPRAKLVWAHEDMYRLGRLKYQRALRGIKDLQENGWKYKEKVITLEPLSWDKRDYGLEEADLL